MECEYGLTEKAPRTTASHWPSHFHDHFHSYDDDGGDDDDDAYDILIMVCNKSCGFSMPCPFQVFKSAINSINDLFFQICAQEHAEKLNYDQDWEF